MKASLRRPLCAGNWKLYKTRAESCALVQELLATLPATAVAEVAVAPVFTALAPVSDLLAATRGTRGTHIALAAQDVYWEPEGAFTGAVSPVQLRDVGCTYVIVGHSERRQLFGETDESVNKKTRAVFAHGMTPIVCVGETLAEREAGQAQAVVVRQLEGALRELTDSDATKLVIAYEPVWAIGTGRNAEPADAQEMHARIRAFLGSRFSVALADGIRVLYGGSVKPNNAAALLAQEDVDGALVGGASLAAGSFTAIVAAAG